MPKKLLIATLSLCCLTLAGKTSAQVLFLPRSTAYSGQPRVFQMTTEALFLDLPIGHLGGRLTIPVSGEVGVNDDSGNRIYTAQINQAMVSWHIFRPLATPRLIYHVSLGVGVSHVGYFEPSNYTKVADYEWRPVSEPLIALSYKLFDWANIGAAAAYRLYLSAGSGLLRPAELDGPSYMALLSSPIGSIPDTPLRLPDLWVQYAEQRRGQGQRVTAITAEIEAYKGYIEISEYTVAERCLLRALDDVEETLVQDSLVLELYGTLAGHYAAFGAADKADFWAEKTIEFEKERQAGSAWQQRLRNLPTRRR